MLAEDQRGEAAGAAAAGEAPARPAGGRGAAHYQQQGRPHLSDITPLARDARLQRAATQATLRVPPLATAGRRIPCSRVGGRLALNYATTLYCFQ